MWSFESPIQTFLTFSQNPLLCSISKVRIFVAVWCKTLSQGMHLSPETQNLCSIWLRKRILFFWAGCWPEHTTFLIYHGWRATCIVTFLPAVTPGCSPAPLESPEQWQLCSYQIHRWELRACLRFSAAASQYSLMTIKSLNVFKFCAPFWPPRRNFFLWDTVTRGHCRLIGHSRV